MERLSFNRNNRSASRASAAWIVAVDPVTDPSNEESVPCSGSFLNSLYISRSS